MKVKQLRFAAVALCLLALMTVSVSVSWAEVHRSPLQGTLSPLVTTGDSHGYLFDRTGGGGAEAIPGNLYDAIPTAAGGTGTGVSAFFDWTAPVAAWGDDLHGAAGTINTINYGYLNTVAASTHLIYVHAMAGPSAPHVSGTLAGPALGTLLATLTIPGNPTGTFLNSITGLSIPNPTGSVWIHFNEAAPGAAAGPTFWWTGMIPGNGFSHLGLGYGFAMPGTSYFYGFPGAPAPGYLAPGTAANINVALNMIPEPAAISLMALAGVAVLAWRRRG